MLELNKQNERAKQTEFHSLNGMDGNGPNFLDAYTSYASVCVKNEITKFLSSNVMTIKLGNEGMALMRSQNILFSARTDHPF